MKNPIPSIYEHTSLGAYLTRHYQYRKFLNPTFSYRVWARRLKVRTPSSLCMIVKGTRLPSKALAEKLKRDLTLDEQASRYFDLLVDCKKLGEDAGRILQSRKLESLQPSRGFRLVERDEFQRIANWIHYALLEMIELKGFRPDAAWVSRNLNFDCGVAEVLEAFEVLRRLGFVAQDKKGAWVRVPGRITTGHDVSDEALKIFHEQSLGNAAKAIRKLDPKEREIIGLTLCMKEAQLPVAKKRIRAFLEEFCVEFDSSASADAVYQFELALFPLFQMKKSRGET